MRKPWTPHARAKARETFWAPVIEQAGVIIDNIHRGDINLYDVIDDLGTHVDSTLFGNRLDNPVSKRALKLLLRKEFHELLEVA